MAHSAASMRISAGRRLQQDSNVVDVLMEKVGRHPPRGRGRRWRQAGPVAFLLGVAAYLAVAVANAAMILDRSMTDKIVPLVIGGLSLLACTTK